ncbi:MAG TPA: 4Fe-4S binding protein [Methanolinea sp.]|jgi:formate hydrogenlyase subunit 6/NADH:ubiquinone oxidoreductase subunit I|nr:MAG: Tungsten-containing formylmethanofuran dehydrogenase 2 subunit G [Methanoregulaceae archaeon PtaB.Bin009]OPY41701.1 MAG: Tungsten-containing formylmethanofuran dehydrogenase 2 subunit G [Methanoregulaceae archaeon PtaU1.Bin066]HII77107.1 4Fe-4S binding protein [Methanolinea sp.]HNQ29301.1 4Fe-4S binding protein [Methanolinea sp.]
MPLSIVYYAKEFFRGEWARKFLAAKTAPLVTPTYFRNYPELTGKTCTHHLFCMMACPAPGAIDVVRTPEGWMPRIHVGHCIRCGLCVEACPNGVLRSGRILESMFYDNTKLSFSFRIDVDTERCMGCGNCAVACPVNKLIDSQMSHGGRASTDDLLLKVNEGKCQVLHVEKCTGCKTCEHHCPNEAIHVARLLEAVHAPEDEL